MLRQALTLAADRGLLSQVPKIRKLSELGRERTGFFERAEFEAVVAQLPEYLQDFVRFAYLTGWRKGAIASLMWADVDPEGRVIRLRPENDKTGSGQFSRWRGNCGRSSRDGRQNGYGVGIGYAGLPPQYQASTKLPESMGDRVPKRRGAEQAVPRLPPDGGTEPCPRRAFLSGWQCPFRATRRGPCSTATTS